MKIKETVSKIHSLIKGNEHLVNFTALVVAIVALIIAIIAFISIPTVNAKPISVVDFCPSVEGAGKHCNGNIEYTCGKEKNVFALSCEEETDYFRAISAIYNTGSSLARNIIMEIQFENNSILTNGDYTKGEIEIYENGNIRKESLNCKDNCIKRVKIPILKSQDSFELRLTFNRGDFKEKPKYVKFILYQDGENKGEKTISISYKQNNNNFSNLIPQQINGIVTYRNIAANNATVLVRKDRTGEVMTTSTNDLGQYLVDLSNMKLETFYKDFIYVTACFKNICSAEKEIKADTALGANDDVNINIE
ncbi:MAG: hypothetical protein WA139_05530 [Candidatus Aenigmatarchaeota archaeon]